MKRTLSGFMIIALFYSLFPVSASAQDDQAARISKGKEILEQYIIASGGREKLLKIRDTTILSELNVISMGLSASRVIYIKDFEKIRIETKIMGTTTILSFDGKIGWIMNQQTMTAVDMPQPLVAELKIIAMGNGEMLDPDRFGITTTYEGKKAVEDKEYLILKQAFKDGNTSTLYIDPDTHLIYKKVSLSLDESLQKVETESVFSDYRVVEGMKVPFSLKIIQHGSEYVDYEITGYKYNTGLTDSFFEKP